jgi:hypothetical protein
MKLTRKAPSLSKILKEPGEGEKEEIAPSLFIHDLPNEIPGMPEKGDFEAHCKGKVRRHSVTTENGKTHHSYDLDVHHLEPKNGGMPKKKESTREQVEKAFKEKGPKDEDEK